MEDSKNVRTKAVNALNSMAAVFLEANLNKKHSDEAATAICKPFLEEYESIVSSKGYSGKSEEPISLPPFRLNDQLKELQKRVEDKNKRKITDADVRALFKKGNSESDKLGTVRSEAVMQMKAGENSKSDHRRSTELKAVSNVTTSEPPSKFIKQDNSSNLSKPFQQVKPEKKWEKLYQRKTESIAPIPVSKPDRGIAANSTSTAQRASVPIFKSASTEYYQQKALAGGNVNNKPPRRYGLSSLPSKAPSKANETAETPMEIDEDFAHPLMKKIDPKLLEMIKSEIVIDGKEVLWGDVSGLVEAKKIIHEAVILPLMRPDLFEGLRSVPKGILLFGPPGTGKTLIGKCIASCAKATFFSISASTLTSKWIGEGEKLVKALFLYARVKQPSVVFIDEIDSILQKRNDHEHESSRRLKTEFMIQLEGATTDENDRVLLIGATNRPQELDDAVRRRFTKRLYIPLPDCDGRCDLINNLLRKSKNNLSKSDILQLGRETEGYSGSDINNLCRDAAMNPVRELSVDECMNVSKDELRPMNLADLRKSLKTVKATVSPQDIQAYVDWNLSFGSTV